MICESAERERQSADTRTCEAVIDNGSRFIDPEPPDGCANAALDGQDYCEEHADE